MVLQVTDWLKKWWFLVSSVALAIMYALYAKQGRTLKELHTQSQIDLLSQQAKDIHEQLGQEGLDNEKSRNRYEDLKRIHGDTLKRLGIVLGSGEPGDGGGR